MTMLARTMISMPPRRPFRMKEHLLDAGNRDYKAKNSGVQGAGGTLAFRTIPLDEAVERVYGRIADLSKSDERLRVDVLNAGLGHPAAQERIKAIIAGLLTESRLEVDAATLIEGMSSTTAIFAQTCGAGLLEDLYRLPDVEEVQVNGCDIYLVRNGMPVRHKRRFSSLEEVRLLQDRLALCGQKPINEKNPVRQTYLFNRSRLVMTREPYSDVPTICIRNFIVRDVSLEGLAELGTMSPKMARFLRLVVRHHGSILIGGGTNTGKTTLLFALTREIPDHERILTLEKEFEIALRDRLGGDRNIVALREVEETGLTMEEAFKPMLVMSPKWVVVGEAKGAEVSQMVQGSLRGHDIMGTMHTKYRESFVSDVMDMIKQDGRRHDDRTLRSRIARAFNLIVYLRLICVNGMLRRVVTEITELHADADDVVHVDPLVVWDYEKKDWAFTGRKLSRPFMEHLMSHEADAEEFRGLGVAD